MKYFLSAGEASGDLHASQLIAALKQYDSDAVFMFLGGDMMHEVAGAAPVIHYNRMAYMGFTDVIAHLPQVLGNLSAAKKAIESYRPDAVILVDYPSFNLKLAAHAHSLGIPVYYYISPKVWAWKEHRVKQIKRYVRRMYSILPFETDFYRNRHNYEITYVGNPSVEEIDNRAAALPPADKFLESHGITDSRPVIAIVPGSRRGEISRNLPIMTEAASHFPEYQAIVAGAPGIEQEYYSRFTTLPVFKDSTFELMSAASAALVTSGTATLEAALIGTPQVVCYRSNGSRLTYKMYSKLLKIPFVSLPNLICNREIVKELLMHYCTVDNVSRQLSEILPGTQGNERMRRDYRDMRRILGDSQAAANTARSIISDLNRLHTQTARP